MSNADTIGQSYRRVGGVERVTGEQRYAADIALDGALHVKLVYLDTARAAIRGIDTERARAVPGVAGPSVRRCHSVGRHSGSWTKSWNKSFTNRRALLVMRFSL